MPSGIQVFNLYAYYPIVFMPAAFTLSRIRNPAYTHKPISSCFCAGLYAYAYKKEDDVMQLSIEILCCMAVASGCLRVRTCRLMFKNYHAIARCRQ
jgi:hypothetical protein